MKTIFTSLRTAAIILLLSVCALSTNATVTVTQNQGNRVTSTTFGKGTTNQIILEVVVVTPTGDATHTVSNAKFTLTGAEQIARVAVYPNSYGNPEFEKAPFAIADNPGATVSLDGSYAIPAGSNTRYLSLVVDLKADASTGTQIDAVCTEITSTAGTFTPSATTSTKTITVADNLSGTRTVKNAGGDYATLTAAIADINLYGVGTAGLTIEVADDETITQTGTGNILRQSGTASNPLVIKRSGTGTNKPIIVATNNGNSNFDTNIGGMGVDYVIIDGLDLRATGGTGKTESPVYFYGSYNKGCNNIEVKNCDIDCATSTLPSDNGIYLTSNAKGTVNGDVPNTNIKIHDNTITNAKSGIYVNYNLTATVNDSGHEIYNNTITAGTVNTFTNGIRYKHCNGIKIYNNTIDGTGHTSTAAVVGIGADSGSSISGTADIYGNSIKNLTTNTNNNVYGLYLTGSTGSTINAYNNAIANISNIHTTTTKTTAGIRKDGAGITYLWHNSVYINLTVTNTGIVTQAFSDNYSSEVIQFINNVFVNTSVTGGNNTKNSTFAMSNNNKIADGSDNNLYYPINADTRIKVGSSYYSTIADYKTALSTREQASVTGDPLFVDAANNDLTITDALSPASNAGTSVAAVTTDILGTARHGSKPDLGAYEDAHAPVSTLIADLLNKQHNIYSANGSIVAKISEAATVTVIDAKGSVIYKKMVNAQTLSIPVSKKGMYIISILNNKENTSEKVVVL